MNLKEITDNTGWSLIEILKRINSLPYVTEEITIKSLEDMTKEEFKKFLLGRTWEDIND
ncbi:MULTISPECIES: hypothetical protein [Staphylococcus]|uniref:hypothetical protein n=1 Tax=Staphylococcus TaxID=1279 RepID=UPI000A79FF13|nr:MULTISPECIES: hypothetical protein [Staphylococcus]MBY7664010.1 hypothetical protein [Staphylococcus agnetis]MCO4339646.1 hypothetical protein [Staphylococcus agnetis]MCO4341445.1 hypothetical protein [Staphylococcus agnetis]MCO4344412.1 hypothetical protein [Staphylococcus agnetis]MCO4346582.1 hypothetical protein [Staphylococcus agnetis]